MTHPAHIPGGRMDQRLSPQGNTTLPWHYPEQPFRSKRCRGESGEGNRDGDITIVGSVLVAERRSGTAWPARAMSSLVVAPWVAAQVSPAPQRSWKWTSGRPSARREAFQAAFNKSREFGLAYIKAAVDGRNVPGGNAFWDAVEHAHASSRLRAVPTAVCD